MKFQLRHLGYLAAGLAVAFILVSAVCAWLFTGPQRRAVKPLPANFGHAVEDVRFAATDGVALSGWLVPSPGARRGVVLLHGNGSTRDQMTARARLLRREGWAVLLYDARGHGRSDGRLVSLGWHETNDLVGAIEFLRSKGCAQIGVIGVSQGASTIALAGERLRGVDWVVLESAYKDILSVLDVRFRHAVHLPGWLAGCLLTPIAAWRVGVPAAEIAPVKTVGRLGCPVFVLNGALDWKVPEADARALYDATAAPKEFWLVPNARHVDFYGSAGPEYERRVLAFIRQTWPAP